VVVRVQHSGVPRLVWVSATMTMEPADGPVDPAAGYIRGGAGLAVSRRQVLLICLALLVIGLLALTVVLVTETAHDNARHRRLQTHGVAVQVTVTSCVGTATGTGITVNGFTCEGSFSLDGRRHVDQIRGTSALLSRGRVIAGITDPSSPGTLLTAHAVRRAVPSWHSYIGPVIPGGIAAVVVAAGLVGARIGRRRGD
jgi:hypothetical protein